VYRKVKTNRMNMDERETNAVPRNKVPESTDFDAVLLIKSI